MDPFALPYEMLVEDFARRGIQFDTPGFCDDEAFQRVEQFDSTYLNHYAAFVAKQPYSTTYLERARRVIPECASLLNAALIKNGRMGACIDITGMLFRMLEKEAIWSICIKGSLTITFPRASGIMTRFFWSVDHGDFVAGHAWLYAPPFTVVDVSVKQQEYDRREFKYLPDLVVTENTEKVAVEVGDIVSPSARAHLLAVGVPAESHLRVAAQHIPSIFNAFRPIQEHGLVGARLKYSPVAIHAPIEKLEGITNMTFDGQTIHELYEQKIRDRLKPVSVQ